MTADPDRETRLSDKANLLRYIDALRDTTLLLLVCAGVAWMVHSPLPLAVPVAAYGAILSLRGISVGQHGYVRMFVESLGFAGASYGIANALFLSWG